MLKQVRLYIKGEVIGVGFRAWTKIQAKIIGVNGQVKNVHDHPDLYGDIGGVEAIVQGEENKIQEIIEKIKQGSPVSRVDEVEIIFEDPKEIFDSFEIIC